MRPALGDPVLPGTESWTPPYLVSQAPFLVEKLPPLRWLRRLFCWLVAWCAMLAGVFWWVWLLHPL